MSLQFIQTWTHLTNKHLIYKSKQTETVKSKGKWDDLNSDEKNQRPK